MAPRLRDPHRIWKRVGVDDPYFAVWTADEFRKDNLTEHARERFFASGERHYELLSQIIHSQLDAEFSPKTALDFGCGVGRLTLPMAKRCRDVVGVDVSPGMLAEARRICAQSGTSNISFVAQLGDIEPGRTFDFVHTFIVLQHIRPRRGTQIFSDLLDRLGDGGVGVVQVTYGSSAPALERVLTAVRRNVPLVNRLFHVACGRPFRQPYFRMNAYPLNDLVRLLQGKGCENVVLRFTDHGGHLGVVFLFQKRRCTQFA